MPRPNCLLPVVRVTVPPVPLGKLPRIADDDDILLHPCPVIDLLYPPREHRVSHQPLEVHIIPIM